MTNPANAELAQLESLLQATLLPKHPRANYGQDLHRRLSNRSAPTLELPPRDISLVWFLLITVLLLAMILFGVKFFVIRIRAVTKSQRLRV